MKVSKIILARIYDLERYIDQHYPHPKMLEYRKKQKYEFTISLLRLNKDLLRYINPERYKDLANTELIQ